MDIHNYHPEHHNIDENLLRCTVQFKTYNSLDAVPSEKAIYCVLKKKRRSCENPVVIYVKYADSKEAAIPDDIDQKCSDSCGTDAVLLYLVGTCDDYPVAEAALIRGFAPEFNGTVCDNDLVKKDSVKLGVYLILNGWLYGDLYRQEADAGKQHIERVYTEEGMMRNERMNGKS